MRVQRQVATFAVIGVLAAWVVSIARQTGAARAESRTPPVASASSDSIPEATPPSRIDRVPREPTADRCRIEVVDPNGDPVVRAFILPASAADRSLRPDDAARTDDAGTAAIDVRHLQGSGLAIGKCGFETAFLSEPRSGQAYRVTLQNPPPATIRVENRHGRAVPGVRVRLSRMPLGATRDSVRTGDLAGADRRCAIYAFETDKRGVCEVRGVPSGEYFATFDHDRFVLIEQKWGTLSVPGAASVRMAEPFVSVTEFAGDRLTSYQVQQITRRSDAGITAQTDLLRLAGKLRDRHPNAVVLTTVADTGLTRKPFEIHALLARTGPRRVQARFVPWSRFERPNTVSIARDEVSAATGTLLVEPPRGPDGKWASSIQLALDAVGENDLPALIPVELNKPLRLPVGRFRIVCLVGPGRRALGPNALDVRSEQRTRHTLELLDGVRAVPLQVTGSAGMTVPAAAVTLVDDRDNETFDLLPLEAQRTKVLWFAPGRHRLTLRCLGFETLRRTVEVVRGMDPRPIRGEMRLEGRP